MEPDRGGSLNLIIFLILVGFLLLVTYMCASSSTASAAPAVQSCNPPAANWKTLVACRTETAAALVATSTPAATRTHQATPTKVTPGPTEVPLVVFVDIELIIGTSMPPVDLGIVQLREGETITLRLRRVDQFPRPTATPTSLPEPTP